MTAQYFMIIVDGIPWEDADGNDMWLSHVVYGLADAIADQGYDDIEIVTLTGQNLAETR
jgi:hypothetical protein